MGLELECVACKGEVKRGIVRGGSVYCQECVDGDWASTLMLFKNPPVVRYVTCAVCDGAVMYGLIWEARPYCRGCAHRVLDRGGV